MKKFGKWLKRAVAAGVAIYALFCAVVYLYPQYFFYNPTHTPSNLDNARAKGFMAERVDYASEDGTPLFGWYIPPRRNNLPLVVFMHGNSYNIETFYNKMQPLAEAGYGVFMPEYRGFGGVEGKISQANLEADAIAAVRKLQQMGYDNSRMVIYGMSLGSHMATNSVYKLQNDGNFAGLILEVPFDNIENVVRLVVPVPLPLQYIVRDKYHNEEMLSDVNAPLLLMGGTHDRTVPVELAKKLYTFAKEPKNMIIYEGGTHSGLYDLQNYKDVLSWLENLTRK